MDSGVAKRSGVEKLVASLAPSLPPVVPLRVASPRSNRGFPPRALFVRMTGQENLEFLNVLAEGSNGFEKDVARAAELYCRAMDEGGHVEAMSKLGDILETGMDGVEKDLGRAVDLY